MSHFEEENNSFIYLEKGTLNLVLSSILSGTKNDTPHLVNEEFALKALEQLDQIIHDNEKEFTAIINLLKEVT